MARRLRPEVLEFISEQLAIGQRTGEAQAATCKHFGLSPRQARRYTQAVRKQWAKAGDVDKSERRALLRDQAEHVFRQAIGLGHLKTCISALKFLADLDGINAPQKVEVENTTALAGDGRLTNLDELRRRVAQLTASIGARSYARCVVRNRLTVLRALAKSATEELPLA